MESLRGTREAGKDPLDSLQGTREAPARQERTIWTAWEAPGRHQGGKKGFIGQLARPQGGRLDSQRHQGGRKRGTREATRAFRRGSCATKASKRGTVLRGPFRRGACATRAKAQRPERRVLGIRVTIYMASALPGMVPPQGWCQARGCLPGKPPPPLAGGCRLGPHGARPGRALLFRV